MRATIARAAGLALMLAAAAAPAPAQDLACGGGPGRDARPYDPGDPGSITGVFDLVRVTTSWPEPFTDTSRLTLRLATAEERAAAREEGIGRVPRRVTHVGTITTGEYTFPAEADGAHVRLACVACLDASPVHLYIAAVEATGFHGLWRDFMTGVAIAVDEDGHPRPDPAGSFCAWRAPDPGDRRVDLSHLFDGGAPVEATFVLLNGETGAATRHDPRRAAERFLPASTFKIPHTLIALETGVVPDADFVIPFDSTRVADGFWAAEWSRDHTLRSAFRNSVYWYYQETARRIGEARMSEYLERFDYGNSSMAGGLDAFWLHGGLRISPDEQVRFLQRMYEGELGVSDRSTGILKSIMTLDRVGDCALSGKTGTANVTGTRELAWLVGYVECPGDVWYFALNMEGEEVWERWGAPAARRALVVEILEELGVWSPSDRSARLDSALTALHDDGLFSGALAISDAEGQVVYEFAIGEYEGDPITPRTPMYLASVTKAMTAAAALALAADGILDLDAPVGRYLDPWPYPGVTIRHLLDQTAGLHFLTALTAHGDTMRAVTTSDLLRVIDERRPGLVHEPGAAFDYDNANYEALAAVLESVTGRPYAEVMRERVIEPAGMVNATTGSSGEIAWAGWAGGGGDAVLASVRDLVAFDDAFWSGLVVPDSLVRAALRPPILADGTESRYVFGRFLTDDPRPLVGHFGEGAKAKSALWRERAGSASPGTTYALIVAGDGVHRTPILALAMSAWNGEPFDLPVPRPVADVPRSVLARHVGIYESGFGRLHVTLEDGQLHLEPEGAGGSEPLIAGSATVFYFCCQDLTWEFVLDDEGETVGIQLEGQPATFGEKVEPEPGADG